MAWTAIFISLLSLCVSGAVLFLNYKDGVLVGRLKTVRDETTKILGETKKRFGEKDDGGLKWDKVRERLDRIETMIRDKDDRAGYYMDVLEKDLSLMREYASDKGSGALGKTMDGLKTARERLADDAEDAAKRVKGLSADLAGRIKDSEDSADSAEQDARDTEKDKETEPEFVAPKAAEEETKEKP